MFEGKSYGMRLTRDKILDVLQKNRDTIDRFGARSLALFGSVARGEQRETSDLDFLVELKSNSFDAYMDLKFYLEELFGCKVDLVLADTVKKRLKNIINQEAIHAAGL